MSRLGLFMAVGAGGAPKEFAALSWVPSPVTYDVGTVDRAGHPHVGAPGLCILGCLPAWRGEAAMAFRGRGGGPKVPATFRDLDQ